MTRKPFFDPSAVEFPRSNSVSASWLIFALALYPLVSVAAPLVVFHFWPSARGLNQTLPLAATLQQEGEPLIRGAVVPLIVYLVLSCCVILWARSAHLTSHQVDFEANHWKAITLRGIYVGLAWAGIWLWMWLLLSNPRRLSREVPGFTTRPPLGLLVWAVGAFSEEAWRVVGIAALLANGSSSAFSVVATALMYAVAFVPSGLERAALAFLEGSILGVLFVWQGSFFAPVAAHLAIQAVYLWGLGQFSSIQTRQNSRRSRALRCPVCQAQLSRLQIKLRESFSCPACRQELSVSDRYRLVMRWAGIIAYISLFVCSVALLYDQIQEQAGGIAIALVWPIAWGVGTSLLLLYQKLFPPRLQPGEPDLLTLKIGKPTSHEQKLPPPPKE